MPSIDNQANWHWAEGMKFALEGVKLQFLLNGAASVSLLTFIGHLRAGSASLVWALVAFSLGAASTIPAMIFAYLTQLHYGNAAHEVPYDARIWGAAIRLHYWAYAFVRDESRLLLGGYGTRCVRMWQMPAATLCPS